MGFLGEAFCCMREYWKRVGTLIYVVPKNLVLGVQEVGQKVAAEVFFGSRKGRKVTVAWVDEIGRKIVISSGDRSAQIVRVTEHIRHMGAFAESIRFVVETEDQERQLIDVPISYFGVTDAKSF